MGMVVEFFKNIFQAILMKDHSSEWQHGAPDILKFNFTLLQRSINFYHNYFEELLLWFVYKVKYFWTFTVHKDPCRLSFGKWKWWDISFETITGLRTITSIFTDCCNLMFLLWEASCCITKHWSRSKVSDFHHIYALWFSVFPCKDSNFYSANLKVLCEDQMR